MKRIPYKLDFFSKGPTTYFKIFRGGKKNFRATTNLKTMKAPNSSFLSLKKSVGGKRYRV